MPRYSYIQLAEPFAINKRTFEVMQSISAGPQHVQYARGIRILLAYFNSRPSRQFAQEIQVAAHDWACTYFSRKRGYGRDGARPLLQRYPHLLTASDFGFYRLHEGPPKDHGILPSNEEEESFPEYIEPTLLCDQEIASLLQYISTEPPTTTQKFTHGDCRSLYGPWAVNDITHRVTPVVLSRHPFILHNMPEVIAQIGKANFQWTGLRNREGKPICSKESIEAYMREEMDAAQALLGISPLPAPKDEPHPTSTPDAEPVEPPPQIRVSRARSIVLPLDCDAKELCGTPVVAEGEEPPRPQTPEFEGDITEADLERGMERLMRRRAGEPRPLHPDTKWLLKEFIPELQADGTYARRPKEPKRPFKGWGADSMYPTSPRLTSVPPSPFTDGSQEDTSSTDGDGAEEKDEEEETAVEAVNESVPKRKFEGWGADSWYPASIPRTSAPDLERRTSLINGGGVKETEEEQSVEEPVAEPVPKRKFEGWGEDSWYPPTNPRTSTPDRERRTSSTNSDGAEKQEDEQPVVEMVERQPKLSKRNFEWWIADLIWPIIPGTTVPEPETPTSLGDGDGFEEHGEEGEKEAEGVYEQEEEQVQEKHAEEQPAISRTAEFAAWRPWTPAESDDEGTRVASDDDLFPDQSVEYEQADSGLEGDDDEEYCRINPFLGRKRTGATRNFGDKFVTILTGERGCRL